MNEDILSCYRILELEPESTLDEVKRSYRDLVKVWHPDRFPNNSKLQKKGEGKLKQINFAYEQICKSHGKESLPKHTTTKNADTNPESAFQTASNRGQASNHNKPSYDKPPQDSPLRQKPRANGEINWPIRLMKFTLTVFGFALIKGLFSVSGNSHRPTQEYQPAYAESARNVHSLESTSAIQPQTRQLLSLNEIILLHGKDRQRRKWPESFSVDEISRLREGLLKGNPDAHMSVAEFSRYMQEHHTAYDYSAGLTYSPICETPQSEPQLSISSPHGEPSNQLFPLIVSKLVDFVNRKPRNNGRVDPTIDLVGERSMPNRSSNIPDYFTVGSTRDKVLAVQGTPDRFTDTRLDYGTSFVVFDNGKVNSWNNGYPSLKAKLMPSAAVGTGSYFTVGSTRDEVLAVQGTPDRFTNSRLDYGTSFVVFDNGKVNSWNNVYPSLKAKLMPSAAVRTGSYFTVGSTRDEVLAVQGTPDRFTNSRLDYGTSFVVLDSGSVRSWNNGYPPLKVELLPSVTEKDSNSVTKALPLPEGERTLYRISGLSLGDTLNVRGGPGVQHSVVTQLQNGMRVTVVGAPVSNGPDKWLPCLIAGSVTDPTTGISWPSQQKGWINSMFVEVVQTP